MCQQAAWRQTSIFWGGRVLWHVADSHNMPHISEARKASTCFAYCNKHDLSDYSILQG